MFHRMNRLSLQFLLKIFSVLVLHLLLTHSCRGQSQLIGPSQPIAATVDDDIMLPCQLQPAEDVSALTVEWTRSDLDPIFVHVRRAGQDVTYIKHPSYKDRTSLSIDGLKQGNISLKLSKVKLSDGGKYRCFIPELSIQSFVELIVDAVSSPVISLAGIDRVRGGVVLQCESKGWHPQPEVLWLDSEGNLLSAEPTETVRGPDYLYTVSSRVTVEKRHSNNFTCRVQNTNQIRETNIIVAEDFFQIQPSSSSAIIRLAVTLVVCIGFIVAVFFFGWKWRQSMIKTKSCWDETEGGGNKKLSKSDDPEMHPLNVVDTDGETFTVTTAVSEENKRKKEKKNKRLDRKQTNADRLLQEEKQNREEEVKDLKNQLDSNQNQVENKQAECDLTELQQPHEENQRRQRELQTLKENLETKTKEVQYLIISTV
ncbi:butyrophilin subfamily 3 member A2-like isoform X2 [Scomber japonicus]|uniref:butyrophilin subfamily 3 member A2-like isoform X2 n=1 Tax=Scomber japonicus TaxID=13676 RepID=UPI002306465C|nr:butyrophilin subfamily 3 member A2-like isoform X2 [Scomber japonicus]